MTARPDPQYQSRKHLVSHLPDPTRARQVVRTAAGRLAIGTYVRIEEAWADNAATMLGL
jgi:hypothetical protein